MQQVQVDGENGGGFGGGSVSTGDTGSGGTGSESGDTGSGDTWIGGGDIWSTGEKFLDKGTQNPTMTQSDVSLMEKLGIDTKKGFKELIDFLWGIGLLVIFVSTVVLGIKYMLVLPAEKSRLKQSTTPYVIGVITIFGALTIWKFVIMVLERVL